MRPMTSDSPFRSFIPQSIRWKVCLESAVLRSDSGGASVRRKPLGFFLTPGRSFSSTMACCCFAETWGKDGILDASGSSTTALGEFGSSTRSKPKSFTDPLSSDMSRFSGANSDRTYFSTLRSRSLCPERSPKPGDRFWRAATTSLMLTVPQARTSKKLNTKSGSSQWNSSRLRRSVNASTSSLLLQGKMQRKASEMRRWRTKAWRRMPSTMQPGTKSFTLLKNS
mmetsp:Transcript_102937/g.185769  ORF Transcript_102937/g.185769 Transcript_102937/m.185769 type:complete len:225 (-) Transcript_102937:19-693(-)